jgi:7,8-dihydropterin-6-yl-methyl-4-(beta-D-ribofuranosyl)aminobenzene 5'-phosphate synthase
MGIRLTTMSENSTAMGDLLGEWGLSVLVETGAVNILFDTGKSISLASNADTLGIDLGKIDRVVLSHGHYDHTGGLYHLLRRTRKKLEVIAHPDCLGDKYSRREGQEHRYIGVPHRRQYLESCGATFNLTTGPVKITDTVMTTGEVLMQTDFETVAPTLYVREGEGWLPDPVLDDQALIIKTGQGLAVVLGCAHRGIINTLYQAQQLTGVKEIHTVVGGAHLVGESEERVWRTIAALKELDIQRLGLCHCTGLPAVSLLAQEFGERFFFNVGGTVIDLP